MQDWRDSHREVIQAFLKYINSQTDAFILKGGTSLMTCYGLDRFSEDIDLDAEKRDMKALIRHFCELQGYELRVAKETSTTKRYFIDYHSFYGKSLKVEVSYRNRHIDPASHSKIEGVEVYNINTLALMKSYAYSGRDKIRDLYDVCFIVNHYFEDLTPTVLDGLRNALNFKGLEHFDYIIHNQQDDLIDPEKLLESFLVTYERLGLLLDEEDLEIAQENEDEQENLGHRPHL